MLLQHAFLSEIANTTNFIPIKRVVKEIPYYNVFPDCNRTNTYNITDFIRISNVTSDRSICLIGNFMIASDSDFKVNVAFPFLQTATSSTSKYGFEYTQDVRNPLLILSNVRAKTLEQVKNFIEYPIARLVCENKDNCTFDVQSIPLSYVLENSNVGHKVIVNTDLDQRLILDVARNQANSTSYSTSAVFLSNLQGDFVYTKGKKDTVSVPEQYEELCNSIEGSSITMHADTNALPTEKYSSFVTLSFQPITLQPNLKNWLFKPFTLDIPVKGGIYSLRSVMDYEFPLPSFTNESDINVATSNPQANGHPDNSNPAFGLLISIMSIILGADVGLYLYYRCVKKNSRVPTALTV